MKRIALTIALLIFIANAQEPLVRNPATPEQAKSMQASAAAQLNLPIERKVEISDGVFMEFVLIPAGEFVMGSPSNEKNRGWDEGPLHQVRISKSFYLGKYEVTQEQYEAILGENPKLKFRSPNLPVENVDWRQAGIFCQAVSNKTGLKMRLPTEAEWEYSCRAGTDTEFYTGNMIDPEQANYDWGKSYNKSKRANSLGRTKMVGSYPPNAFGLYDMHGNVWEWCQDIYKNDYYKASRIVDPVNDGPKGSRVIRGGAWNEGPEKLRSAQRSKRIEGADRRHIGFRVLMEIEQ
ncbi:MAG: formylglycine-generating enzyme family protein [Phycisphaerae bacterium]